MVGLFNSVTGSQRHQGSALLVGAICVMGIICPLAVVLNKRIKSQRKQQEAKRKKKETERLEAECKKQEAERLEAERKKQESERLEAERLEAERLESGREQEVERKKQEAKRKRQEAWRTSPKFNKYWDFAKSEYSKFKMLEGPDDEKDRAARKEIALKILGLTSCKLTKTWLLQHYRMMQRVYIAPLSNEEMQLSYLQILNAAYDELSDSVS